MKKQKDRRDQNPAKILRPTNGDIESDTQKQR